MNKKSPFKLTPQYREYVWGGKRIRPDAERTAEAWVVFEQDTIADGPFAGLSLAAAAQRSPVEILGKPVVAQTGTKFPLLIKVLDCAKWLSLQVHPNNAQARRWEGPDHFGKMEGWFVIEADTGARLISGFKNRVSSEQIKASVGSKDLIDLVGWKDVKTGDSLLIEPGTLHALGPGLLIYEVQQTSDITYRVYDWDRPKTDGRKLHIKQAADVLNPQADGRISQTTPDFSGQKELFACEFFKLDLISHQKTIAHQNTNQKSFHALTVVDKDVRISGMGWERQLARFETLLIPAAVGAYEIHSMHGRCLLAQVPDKE